MVINKEEVSIIVCKHCGETKKRYPAGLFANGKDTRWVDENGRQWSGHTCSMCHAEKTKLKKRLNKKLKDIKIDNL
jgi:hypothetical protein